MIKTNLGKIAITNKGVYSAATTYEALDVVSFNGSSYMAKQQTVGNSPENTNYWQLLAAKGDTPVKGVDYFTQADIASLPQPDLSGYALASDVYSKDDVDDMVAAIESSALKRIIVQELPAVNISSNAIYMIRNLSSSGQNQYDEFMWNENDGSGRWEYIGNTQVDLTGYATESWVNNQGFLKTHQDISGKANSADLATVATTGDYTDLINTPTIVEPVIIDLTVSGQPTQQSDGTFSIPFVISSQNIEEAYELFQDYPNMVCFNIDFGATGSKVECPISSFYRSGSENDYTYNMNGKVSLDVGNGLNLDNLTVYAYTDINNYSNNIIGKKIAYANELTNVAGIPAAPSIDGSYMLKCTVASGVPTYTWEAVTVGGSY